MKNFLTNRFFIVIFFIPLLLPYQKPAILDETGPYLQFSRFVLMILSQSISIGLFLFETLFMLYIGFTGDGKENFPLIALVSQFLCGVLILFLCIVELLSCEQYLITALNKTNQALLVSQMRKDRTRGSSSIPPSPTPNTPSSPSSTYFPYREGEIIPSRTERNILKRNSKEYSIFCTFGIVNGVFIIITSFISVLSVSWVAFFLYSLFARFFEIYFIFILINSLVLKVLREQSFPPTSNSTSSPLPSNSSSAAVDSLSTLNNNENNDNSNSTNNNSDNNNNVDKNNVNTNNTFSREKLPNINYSPYNREGNNSPISPLNLPSPISSSYSPTPLKLNKSKISPSSSPSYQILESNDFSPKSLSLDNIDNNLILNSNNQSPTYIIKNGKKNKNSEIKILKSTSTPYIESTENSPLFSHQDTIKSLPTFNIDYREREFMDKSSLSATYPPATSSSNHRMISDRFPEQEEWLQQQPNWIRKWEK